ncbi:MAG TPA: hypothetical protein VNB64_13445 [Solirubrobacteraceae bacterium]|nr:hypothetical protein [Solirubrobacteraceae bacterium]
MTSDFPACTLAPTALNDRIEEITAIGTDSLIAAVSETEFRFRADDETRKRLHALVEAEASCCAQLKLELTERDDHLTLTVDGPGSQAFHRAFTAR